MEIEKIVDTPKTWRDLVAFMDPGKEYPIGIFIKEFNCLHRYALGLTLAAGPYIRKVNGAYQLTDRGVEFKRPPVIDTDLDCNANPTSDSLPLFI
jgi:hypothetical protein